VTFCAAVAVLTLASVLSAQKSPTEWTRFRGPNGSGHATGSGFPTEFNKTKNMLWRLPLPQGHSSPIIWNDRIYLTAFRGDALFTMAIDRQTGTLLWERQAPETKTRILDKRNNPASPSPALENDRVYVFDGVKEPEDYGSVTPPWDKKDPNYTTTTSSTTTTSTVPVVTIPPATTVVPKTTVPKTTVAPVVVTTVTSSVPS